MFIWFITSFIEENVFSPLSIFGSFVKYYLTKSVEVYFWPFDFVPFMYVSIFLCPYRSVLITPAFVVWFETRKCDSWALFFLLRIALPFWHPLWLHINFRIFKISVKNTIGILIDIALNLEMALGNVNILAILILVIYEHRICSHLFVSSPISFIKVL